MTVAHRVLYVLGAFEPEIAPLSKLMPEEQREVVRCRTTGIGIAESAAATARLLLQAETEGKRASVLFIGSAGSLKPLPEQSLSVISSVTLAESGLSTGVTYLPEAMRRSYAADESLIPELSAALMKAGAVTSISAAYSPLAITADGKLGERLAEQAAAQIENLELFGIAAACATAGVQWNAICPVTNRIGAAANAEWRASHRAASEALAQLLASSVLAAVYFKAES